MTNNDKITSAPIQQAEQLVCLAVEALHTRAQDAITGALAALASLYLCRLRDRMPGTDETYPVAIRVIDLARVIKTLIEDLEAALRGNEEPNQDILMALSHFKSEEAHHG